MPRKIFLDIHHVLRADVVRSLSELQASGTDASSTLKEYFATGKTFQNWPAHNEEGVKGINRFIDLWISQDALAQAKRILYRSVNLPAPEPYSLFRRHPFTLDCSNSNSTCSFKMPASLAARGSILYVAHLYEARVIN